MRVFRIDVPSCDQPETWPTYTGTLGEAKKVTHDLKFKALRADMIVEELDVICDKAGIVALLNEEPVFKVGSLRTWGVSARGKMEQEA